MRLITAPVVLFLLAACASEPRVTECPAIDDPAFNQCMMEHYRPSFRLAVDECLPPVEPVLFQGTWANAFEFDSFVEGKELSAEQAWQNDPGHVVSLVVESTPLEPYTNDENDSVLYISFTGRMVPCNILGDDYDAIIVDELISSRVIQDKPSNW